MVLLLETEGDGGEVGLVARKQGKLVGDGGGTISHHLGEVGVRHVAKQCEPATDREIKGVEVKREDD